jgi:hypothetical protein
MGSAGRGLPIAAVSPHASDARIRVRPQPLCSASSCSAAVASGSAPRSSKALDSWTGQRGGRPMSKHEIVRNGRTQVFDGSVILTDGHRRDAQRVMNGGDAGYPAAGTMGFSACGLSSS